ncbi:unannotated protein [freshwater metagenome]|uniref:Unannotated protein n=1 Tax=freshwater metagenome TaxID=449393 RepID=A0A6J7L938_9ZZZZ
MTSSKVSWNSAPDMSASWVMNGVMRSLSTGAKYNSSSMVKSVIPAQIGCDGSATSTLKVEIR